MGLDRFDAMQAFARVVETGSFTQAANTLHMSRSTVTQLVQQLEARLRVRLLHRSTRKVSVTADGAIYYQRVQRLLADLDDADTSLSDASRLPRGRLRVDMPSPLARLIVVPALAQFHARYPDIQIHVGVSDRPVDLLDENVDCVLRGGPVLEPNLVAREVGRLRLGVYAAPSYLARAGRPQHPLQLLDGTHQIVAFMGARSGPVKRPVMRRGEEQQHFQGRYAVALDDGNAYLSAGLAGLGLICLPHYVVQAHCRAAELKQVFEDWTLEDMPLSLVYAPQRHPSAKLRAFVDWVTALLARALPAGEDGFALSADAAGVATSAGA